FFNPAYRHYPFPLQRWLAPAPRTEFDFPLRQKLLTGMQRRLPLYPMWLERQLQRDPPDLLHAHFGTTACLYMDMARRLNRPLAVTFYGFDYAKAPRLRPAYIALYRQLFAGAQRVIAASEAGCRALQNMGCPSEKLAIVPPGPQLNAFPFSERKKTSGQLRLVQVATITAKKGHLTALEAFRQALPDCPGMEMTLAGERQDKTLAARLERFIRSHNLEDHVHMIDFVEHQAMSGFLKNFDAFIHPSCHTPDGDHEATPVVLLEAQASGLPVLCTDHFDLPAEVLHEHTGLVSPEGDTAALAGHIRRLYRMNEVDFAAMSKRARQHVENHFNVLHSAARLREIYREMLS
ncbi:MAG: glycosyltransferase family 4 protein, partial [Saprospiraceae bacterium]|nr:glycosyltransferase family 4 protein [Saprospiraceae bacterium]